MVDYFTPAESAADPSKYSECVKATANVLKLAGLNVRYFESLNIIEVTLEGRPSRYVHLIPKIINYGTDFKVNYDNSAAQIYYNNHKLDVLLMFVDKVRIRNVLYVRTNPDDEIKGYLNGRMYMSYENKLVVSEGYPEYFESDYTKFDVFNLDFTLSQPQEVNIKNEGIKLVRNDKLLNTNVNTFTFFMDMYYITMGKYTEIDSPGPFKYVNEENEPFAIVFNAEEGSSTLVSADKEIKLDLTEYYEIGQNDGLYAGYEIDDELEGDIHVFCYNYIFFAINYETMEIKELAMRNPQSGKRTKIALA